MGYSPRSSPHRGAGPCSFWAMQPASSSPSSVLSISVVSFPLLLDRDVGVAVAVHTSVRAVLSNPLTMALWGLIVAVSLAIGFLFAFVGLAFVVPILAHASWHLYRRVVP